MVEPVEAVPEVEINFQIDVADVAKGYELSTVKVGDSVRLVGESIDVGFPHKVLDTRIVPDIAEPQLLLTTKSGYRWVTGPFAELSKEIVKPPVVEEVKGSNPIPEELDLVRTLAIIDSRPKGEIIESKLREEFGDAIIDALRQGRYVVSGSAGYNPPLLVSLKGRELIQGGNPVPAVDDLLPMPPSEGPPFPKSLGLKWPWKGK